METILIILAILIAIQNIIEIGVFFKNRDDDKKFEQLTKAANLANENYINSRKAYEKRIEELSNYSQYLEKTITKIKNYDTGRTTEKN